MAEPAMHDSESRNSDSGGSMFREASRINIHGGTFNAYGSSGIDGKKRVTDAMALLASHAERGAPYDAAAREDVPKCHERTRVAIIDGIHKWANSQETDAHPFMWMYGPAGSGKTTIMQTVAETFDTEGSLAASFFFSRLSAARPKEKEKFVITLAHQLSLCIPALQEPLANALSDSSILTKSLVKQLDSLVIGPLKTLEHAEIGPRCIFLVDGLDECRGDVAQRDVLELLEQFFVHQVDCVRILIASRPLSHLQAFFSRGSIGKITHTIPLDNDYQSDGDISSFLDSKFEEIRGEHPSRGGLPSKWPSRDDISVLVKRASGQFIYASVVMKFIANHGRHPDASLQTIITLEAGGEAKPYEELDAVYAQVLSTIEPQNVEFVRTLIGCMLLDENKFYVAHIVQKEATTVVDLLFRVQPGTMEARINRIYPLVTASSYGTKFSHASFPEYLLDRSRSKEFFLDMRKVHCSVARHWFASYSTHFKCHPQGGVVPSNVTGYKVPSYRAYSGDGDDGAVLIDLISHCMEAEWTSALRQDILDFDVQAALRVPPQCDRPEYIRWCGTVPWLDLTFWLEEHHLLLSVEADHIRGCIQHMIQSTLSTPSTSPTVPRIVAAVLTWRKHIHMDAVWRSIGWTLCPDPHKYSEWAGLLNMYNSPRMDHILNTSCLWICRTLVPDSEIISSFFVDGNLYTDVALLYARVQADGRILWDRILPVLLSKALPSTELATLLKQRFLQLRTHHHTKIMQGHTQRDYFRSICIYLFECGIHFHSEHRHQPEFSMIVEACGICLLFDAYKVECPDIELSQDPFLKPGPQPAHIADEGGPQPPQVNLVRQFIPVVPELWLQIWIVWLADIVLRLFPIFA